METTRDANDPTFWHVKVSVETLAGTAVSFVASFNQAFTQFAVNG